MPIRQLLKRAYWVFLIAAPLAWLVFTSEGQRYSDILLLKLKGDPSITLDVDRLRSSLTEARVAEALPDLELTCADQITPFGSRTCQSPLAAFNGTPSRYISFFFENGSLQAVKVGIQRAYQRQLAGHLNEWLGTPMQSTEGDGPGVYQWRAGGGLAVMPIEPVSREDEPAMVWLALPSASAVGGGIGQD